MSDTTPDEHSLPHAARATLTALHEARRDRIYRDFRARIDGRYDFIEENPGVYESHLRRLCRAVCDKEDIFSTGDDEALSKVKQWADKQLRDTMLRHKACSEHNVDKILAELHGDIHTSRRYIADPEKRDTELNEGPCEPIITLPEDDKTWQNSTMRTSIHAASHAAAVYSQQTLEAQREIGRETFTSGLLTSLSQACQRETYNAETAISVAASLMRELYRSLSEKAGDDTSHNKKQMEELPDFDALYSVRFAYHGKPEELKVKQDMMNNSTLSQAIAVVLLACQKTIGRNSAIEIARSIQMYVHHKGEDDEYVPSANKQYHADMKTMNAFIEKLKEMRYLNPDDVELLDRNEKRIQSVLLDYAQSQIPSRDNGPGSSAAR